MLDFDSEIPGGYLDAMDFNRLSFYNGGTNTMIRWIPLALLLAVVGCSSNPAPSPALPEKKAYQRAPAEPWIVSTLDSTAETPAWVSNGFLGFRVGRDGLGAQGPATFFRIDRFQQSGEEKIEGMSSPLIASMTLNGQPILQGAKDYAQTLDLKRGLPDQVKTVWSLKDGEHIETVTALGGNGWSAKQSFVFTKAKGASVDFEIPVPSGATVERVETIDPESAVRYEATLGDDRMTLYFERAKQAEVRVEAGKLIGRFEVEEAYSTVEVEWHFKTSLQVPVPTVEPVDIEIEGPIEDQQAVRSFLFYLRGSIAPGTSMSVSPLALSGQTYNGHVFWDADVWVFPALALLDPARARVITDYRIRLADAARRNLAEGRSWHRRDTMKLDGQPRGLQFPWESSVTGLEVSPTETKQQHHITATVLFALAKAADLGLADSAVVNAIGRDAAEFYLWRSSRVNEKGELDANGKLRSVMQTISPDEFFFGDHDLYTNAAAEWCVRRFMPDRAVPFYRPRDAEGLLNYGGDRRKGYKQAAGVLAVYPLQDREAVGEAQKLMERFADKVIANGPAMADSVHATIWARLGEREAAYSAWRKSWQEFTNHPLNLFSEKRSKDVTYFTTGAGGSLQTVLFGFVGLKIGDSAEPGAAWSAPLKNGRWLSAKPNLPEAWKRVTVRNLSILGRKATLTATRDSVTVEFGD